MPGMSQSVVPTLALTPCQYRTGKTLGSGTYAIVKEAIHVKTGEYFACKVINKKLMEGREHMVRSAIVDSLKVSLKFVYIRCEMRLPSSRRYPAGTRTLSLYETTLR